MSRTQTEYLYTVKFTGDHFTLTTCVQAPDEEHAEQYATQQLLNHHGIDTEKIGAWDITTEEDGEFL
jgi:hypothetical protein